MKRRTSQYLSIALITGISFAIPSSHGAETSAAINELRKVDGSADPATQAAWRTLAASDIGELTTILAGMKEASPLAENWLRAACDAIVDRQLQSGGELPVDLLRDFVLDSSQSPRARRSAYEWIVQVEPQTPDELLPKLLDDPSLELRYDAVEHLLKQVVAAPKDEQKADLLQQAVQASRQFKQIQSIAEQLTKLNRPVDLTKQLGFLTKWQVIGPFELGEGNGFLTSHPPEAALDLAAKYTGKAGEVTWTEATADGELGQMDFCKTFGKDATGIMYAVAKFASPAAQPAQIRYETENGTKLWLNGKLVAENEVFHSGGDWDQYVVPIQLAKGENTILIKVCQTKRTEDWAMVWRYRLRVCDPIGGAIHESVNP